MNVFFLLSGNLTTGVHSYSVTGLQAVLELYFAYFLYVCFSRKFSLSTTSVNVYIAVYQLCALTAGFLADRVLGMYQSIYIVLSPDQPSPSLIPRPFGLRMGLSFPKSLVILDFSVRI